MCWPLAHIGQLVALDAGLPPPLGFGEARRSASREGGGDRDSGLENPERRTPGSRIPNPGSRTVGSRRMGCRARRWSNVSSVPRARDEQVVPRRGDGLNNLQSPTSNFQLSQLPIGRWKLQRLRVGSWELGVETVGRWSLEVGSCRPCTSSSTPHRLSAFFRARPCPRRSSSVRPHSVIRRWRCSTPMGCTAHHAFIRRPNTQACARLSAPN